MKRRPTIKDVAEKCGVHHTTVSRALRDHPSIPAATRVKIKAAADELGYQSDPFLSSLSSRRKNAHAPGSAIANLAWITNFETRDGWKQYVHNPSYF